MDELVQRIVSTVGIDAATAEKAIGMVLGFLKKEGPAEEVNQLFAAMPGAEAAAAAHGGGGGMMSGLMGMMGGGVMALGQQLMSAGLGMGQIQTLSRELFAYAREKGGEDTVGAIVAAVPGLGQFV